LFRSIASGHELVSRKGAILEVDHPASSDWVLPHVDIQQAQQFGLRLRGGGTHQSKTIMFSEISAYWDHAEAGSSHARALIIDANLLNKPTVSTRVVTFRHLNALYAIEAMPAITKTLAALWKLDGRGRPLLALLCALARDPLLRDAASPVLHAPVGVAVRWPAIASIFEREYPGRFSAKMLKSLAQNCVSTWTQSGHLLGAVKKQRVRAEPTLFAAAYAALIGTVCGYGGPALLGSPWMRVLDVSSDRALDLLRQAEGYGLTRVRSAGDVLEVSVRQPMSAVLRIEALAQLR
jgi:hypothetical protein